MKLRSTEITFHSTEVPLRATERNLRAIERNLRAIEMKCCKTRCEKGKWKVQMSFSSLA